MMKRIFFSLIFLLLCGAPAWATQITVSSFQPSYEWRYGGTTATIRVYVSTSFVSSEGVSVLASPVGGSNFYKTINCTISGTTLTVGTFTLYSTTDATPTTARYTLIFFDNKGTKRDVLWSNYQVPVSLGTTISNSQLEIYNRTAPAPPRPGFPTTDQVQQLINAVPPTVKATDAIYGISTLSVPAASSTAPKVIGLNDPRVGRVFNIAGYPYNAVCDGSTADTAAIAAANTAALLLGGAVYVPPSANGCKVGTTTISAPLVSDGGTLLGTNGLTTTITGAIIAPPIQIFRNFTGSGGVVSFAGNHYLNSVSPVWWGASGAGVADAAPAINASIVAMPATGGVVELPTGVYGILSTILVGPNVVFLGQGYQGTEIRALSGFTAAAAMIRNTSIDGTQQQVAVAGFWVNGNSHAAIGVMIEGVGQVSWVKDLTINSCTNVGLLFDGGPPASSAGYFGQNIAVNGSGHQNIVIEGPIQSVWLSGITSQGQGTGDASILVSATNGIEGRQSIQLLGVHMEMFGANSVGIDINNFNNVKVDGVNYIGATPATGDLVKIRGASTNVTIQGIRSQALLNLIKDETVTPTETIDVASHGGQYGNYSTGDSRVANQTIHSTLTVGSTVLNDTSGLVLNQTGADGFVSAGGTNGDLYVQPKDASKTVRVPTGTLAVYGAGLLVGASGTTLTQIRAYAPSLTPSSVSANTSAEQDFTVTGVTTADKVIVNGPAPTVGTGIVNVRVKSSNTVSITFGNFTSGSLTPTSGTYNIVAVRN